MSKIVNIASWGHARVMVRRGRKSRDIPVTYTVPALIEECMEAEAPIASRTYGAAKHDPSVIRQAGNRLLRPEWIGRLLVSCGDLDGPVPYGKGGILHIVPPRRAYQLDDPCYRQIISTGEDEAVAKAGRLASPLMLVDGVLYRETDPPVWMVAVEDGDELPRVLLTSGVFVPRDNARILRFPLCEAAAARQAAKALHLGLREAEMVLQPASAPGVEVLRPGSFAGSALRLTAEDLRREIINIGRSPAIITLPERAVGGWINLRRSIEREAGDASILDDLQHFHSLLAPVRAGSSEAGMFRRAVRTVLEMFKLRISPAMREMSDA